MTPYRRNANRGRTRVDERAADDRQLDLREEFANVIGALDADAHFLPFLGIGLNGAESQGSGDFTPLWAGQNTSGCKEVPAAVLTRELTSALPGDQTA